MLSSFRLRLWDLDGRRYSYNVEVSLDNENWEMVANRTKMVTVRDNTTTTNNNNSTSNNNNHNSNNAHAPSISSTRMPNANSVSSQHSISTHHSLTTSLNQPQSTHPNFNINNMNPVLLNLNPGPSLHSQNSSGSASNPLNSVGTNSVPSLNSQPPLTNHNSFQNQITNRNFDQHHLTPNREYIVGLDNMSESEEEPMNEDISMPNSETMRRFENSSRGSALNSSQNSGSISPRISSVGGGSSVRGGTMNPPRSVTPNQQQSSSTSSRTLLGHQNNHSQNNSQISPVNLSNQVPIQNHLDRRPGQYTEERLILCNSWQYIHFKQRPVCFVKITGTRNTINEVFHLVYFEAPAAKMSLNMDGNNPIPANLRRDRENNLNLESVLIGETQASEENIVIQNSKSPLDVDRLTLEQKIGLGLEVDESEYERL